MRQRALRVGVASRDRRSIRSDVFQASGIFLADQPVSSAPRTDADSAKRFHGFRHHCEPAKKTGRGSFAMNWDHRKLARGGISALAATLIMASAPVQAQTVNITESVFVGAEDHGGGFNTLVTIPPSISEVSVEN